MAKDELWKSVKPGLNYLVVGHDKSCSGWGYPELCKCEIRYELVTKEEYELALEEQKLLEEEGD
jgi:hypothetical protein